MSFINGGIEDATTKKALKEAVKADPSRVYFYGTSPMGPQWSGYLNTLPEGIKLSVVGPLPERRRDWYATVERRGTRVVVS